MRVKIEDKATRLFVVLLNEVINRTEIKREKYIKFSEKNSSGEFSYKLFRKHEMGKMKKYREGNDQKIATTPKVFAYGAENGKNQASWPAKIQKIFPAALKKIK